MVGTQYGEGDQWKNNSRKNEGMKPKQKKYPVVDVTGDRSTARCCKEQYCIGTWNVRSMNQGKLEEVKQEMARPFRYDLSQIPYDYTVELRKRFMRLDAIDRVPDELWMEVRDIVEETEIKTIPMEKKCKKAK